MSRRLLAVLALAIVVAIAVGAALWYNRRSGLPQPGSTAYEQTTRAFYSGLGALEVGLLDDATKYFSEATKLAPNAGQATSCVRQYERPLIFASSDKTHFPWSKSVIQAR